MSGHQECSITFLNLLARVFEKPFISEQNKLTGCQFFIFCKFPFFGSRPSCSSQAMSIQPHSHLKQPAGPHQQHPKRIYKTRLEAHQCQVPCHSPFSVGQHEAPAQTVAYQDLPWSSQRYYQGLARNRHTKPHCPCIKYCTASIKPHSPLSNVRRRC